MQNAKAVSERTSMQGNQGTSPKLLLDRRRFLGLGATVAASTAITLAGWGNHAFAAPGDHVLSIVHTNDVHSYVDVLPYVKGLRDQLAADDLDPNETLIISAGDDFAGTSFASLSAGQDVAEAMNLAGYDIFTIGNHEYMMKANDFKAVQDSLTFSVLGCNVSPATHVNNPSIAPYEIRDFYNTKIAFIGITYQWTDSPDLITSINNAYDAARLEGATLFIGISHLGILDTNLDLRSTHVASNCPWFTTIIDGHSHSELPTGMIENEVLIVQTGEYGNNIGVTEITIDASGTVIGKVAKLIAIKGNESGCGITPDPTVRDFIDTVNARNDAYINEVVLSLPVVLYGERQYSRTQETVFGNLVADAMRAKTGTDLAMFTGPYMRTNLGIGSVTRGELEAALYEDVYLATLKINGEKILETLESGLTSYPGENNKFPHVAGMRVIFDPSFPAGSRVINVILPDGSSLDPSTTYTCTVRENMVSTYLEGGEPYLDGTHYHTGKGTICESFASYLNNGINIPDQIDGRMKARGTSYIIHFDGNGAVKGVVSSIVTPYDTDVTIPHNAFTRDDHTFIAWEDMKGNTYSEGATARNLDDLARGEITLFAQWKQNDQTGTVPPLSTNPPTSGKLPGSHLADTDDDMSLYALGSLLVATGAGAGILTASAKLKDGTPSE